MCVALPTVVFIIYVAHKMTKIEHAKKLRKEEQEKRKQQKEQAKKLREEARKKSQPPGNVLHQKCYKVKK